MGDRETLLAAEHELQAAQLASDVEALARLLHDDLRFIGPDAGVHGKAGDLESHRTHAVVFTGSKQLELEAHVFGETGVTIALLALEVEVGGVSMAGDYRYTRTWIFEDGRWQIIAGAVCAVPG